MSLKDTLELIIKADVKGAVSGFEEVGAAAEKNLAKGASGAQALGSSMQKVGVGMIGVGAVGVTAFAELAREGEKLTASNLKLESSVEHAGLAAGGSVEPFKKLAEEMGKKTEFDHLAVQNSEAMQLQIGLTKEKVLEITPLIADLAAKQGIDLAEATGKVTKALNGKKKGLEALVGPLDATTYATDRYAAVQSALNATVGGFAEEQGKTFSGQIEIMKHQLADLAEGVGQGAVKAFSAMFGAVDTVTGALESLSPGTQSAIGEFGTFAAVGLVGVGVLTTIAGSVMKNVERLGSLAQTLGIVRAAKEADIVVSEAEVVANEEVAASMALTPWGAVAIGIGVVASALALGSMNAEQFTVNAKEMAKVTDGELRASLEGLMAAMHLSGESAYDMGKQLAEQSIPQAERLAAAFGEGSQQAKDIQRAIADVKGEHAKNAEATALDKQATDDLSLSDKGLSAATIDVINALKDQEDQLKATLDPMFAATDASMGLDKAQRTVADAQTKLTEAVRKHGPHSAEATAATLALSDAQYAGVKAAEHQELAMLQLASEVQKNPALMAEATTKLTQWVAEGTITQAAADAITAKFANAGHAADGLGRSLSAIDGRQVTVNFNVIERVASGLLSGITLGAISGPTGPTHAHAGGGFLDPGWNLVGEQYGGGELVNRESGQVLSASRTAQVLSGSGSSVVHVTNYGVIGSEGELRSWLMNSLESAVNAGVMPGHKTRQAFAA